MASFKFKQAAYVPGIGPIPGLSCRKKKLKAPRVSSESSGAFLI